MELPLSLVSTLLGLIILLPALAAFVKPAGLAGPIKRFPRAIGVGSVLIVLATVWFVYNLKVESIADFEPMKPYLMIILVALGVGTCLFLQDFIAVRGLAALMLLVAKLMVDAGRPHLGESPLVEVNQYLAYFFVALGMWLTISPWRLRDWFDWATASNGRLKAISGLVAGLGAFVLVLGMTVFRQMK
jgi:hypothetical protein